MFAAVALLSAYVPEDFTTTLFSCLRIGPDREFYDNTGRPYRIY